MICDELLISIGVHAPSGLGPLAGLDATSTKILSWATSRSRDVVAINDFNGTVVTAEGLRNALPREKLIGRRRVILYFCGHGFFVNGEAGWVLSGGPQAFEGIIGIMKFRDMIGTYGVPNIAIWSDACLSLFHVRGGTTQVLPPGPAQDNLPRTDVFYATREGNPAFVVREADRWRPVFSDVLAEALTADPLPTDAIDVDLVAFGQAKITSQSLGDYIDEEVPARASTHNLIQSPNTATGPAITEQRLPGGSCAPWDINSTTTDGRPRVIGTGWHWEGLSDHTPRACCS